MSDFATTAWGRDWQRLAEPTSVTRPDPALPKARSIARRDQVHELEISPGSVTATVQHNGAHHVQMAVPVWTEEQVQHARSTVGDTDDLPDSAHAALVHDGQPPAPDAGSMTATCGCRTRKRPCAHVLATFFDIARRLDHRPRLALLLRGARDAASATATARIPIGLLDPAHFYD